MIMANLALLLARSGKKVCLVDLDIGGADTHILFGHFSPQYTLTDFLTRKIGSLAEAIHTFYSYNGLQLIAGTGTTLQTANMNFREKQRLLQGIDELEADIVLLDVGAGTSYHALDFFMHADLQICVTQPDPTSIYDLYTFLQLATIRKVLGSFLSQSDIAVALKNNRFNSLQEVFTLAEETEAGSKLKSQIALNFFHPLLIVNKDNVHGSINLTKLANMVAKYLGISIPELGQIPVDPMVDHALRAYLPVCELYPNAPASLSLNSMMTKLEKIVLLFSEYQNK